MKIFCPKQWGIDNLFLKSLLMRENKFPAPQVLTAQGARYQTPRERIAHFLSKASMKPPEVE
jgi:hypothetical protein